MSAAGWRGRVRRAGRAARGVGARSRLRGARARECFPRAAGGAVCRRATASSVAGAPNAKGSTRRGSSAKGRGGGRGVFRRRRGSARHGEGGTSSPRPPHRGRRGHPGLRRRRRSPRPDGGRGGGRPAAAWHEISRQIVGGAGGPAAGDSIDWSRSAHLDRSPSRWSPATARPRPHAAGSRRRGAPCDRWRGACAPLTASGCRSRCARLVVEQRSLAGRDRDAPARRAAPPHGRTCCLQARAFAHLNDCSCMYAGLYHVLDKVAQECGCATSRGRHEGQRQHALPRAMPGRAMRAMTVSAPKATNMSIRRARAVSRWKTNLARTRR